MCERQFDFKLYLHYRTLLVKKVYIVWQNIINWLIKELWICVQCTAAVNKLIFVYVTGSHKINHFLEKIRKASTSQKFIPEYNEPVNVSR